MTFKLEINCDNDAFHGRPQSEVACILRKIADQLERHSIEAGGIIDTNGNHVGQYAFRGKQSK